MRSLLASGETLYATAQGTVSWLRVAEPDTGAAPSAAPRRMLAADSGRLTAGPRLHGQNGHSGRGRRWLGRRWSDAPSGPGLARGVVPESNVSCSWVRPSVSDSIFYLADSREQGIREAGKYYEENLKMFGPLRLVRALSDQQIEDMGDPKKAPFADLPRIETAISNGGVLCGSPDDFIEHLKKLEERYPGLERVMVSLTVGISKTLVLEQLECFAAEVMPAFKATADEPVHAD